MGGEGVGRMTLTEARKILGKEAVGLSDKEIQEIIDWLDTFADIVLNSLELRQLKEEISDVTLTK